MMQVKIEDVIQNIHKGEMKSVVDHICELKETVPYEELHEKITKALIRRDEIREEEGRDEFAICLLIVLQLMKFRPK